MTIWSRDYCEVGSFVKMMSNDRAYIVTDCMKSKTRHAKPGWHIHVRDLTAEERLAFDIMET